MKRVLVNSLTKLGGALKQSSNKSSRQISRLAISTCNIISTQRQLFAKHLNVKFRHIPGDNATSRITLETGDEMVAVHLAKPYAAMTL